jgi:hypothetical protein
MLPEALLKTLYLGDRACKAVHIEGFARRVSIQVDEISRIRSSSGNWEYYNDENIVDGLLVFAGVKEIRFAPSGPIPNDCISDINVEDVGGGYYRFQLSIGSIAVDAPTAEVIITIICKQFYLTDPRMPDLVIDK